MKNRSLSLPTGRVDTTKGTSKSKKKSRRDNDKCTGESLIQRVTLSPSESSSNLLAITSTISGKKVKALIDSGATNNFLSLTWAKANKIPMKRHEKRMTLSLADGSTTHYEHFTTVSVSFKGHTIKTNFDIVNLEHNNAILGIPWLTKVNPTIDWNTKTVLITQPSNRPSTEPIEVIKPKTVAKLLKQGHEGFVAFINGNGLVEVDSTLAQISQGCARPNDE